MLEQDSIDVYLQSFDVAEKLEHAENQLAHTRLGSFLLPSQRKKEVSFIVLTMDVSSVLDDLLWFNFWLSWPRFF